MSTQQLTPIGSGQDPGPPVVDSDAHSLTPRLRSVFEIVGLVLAPASLLTALLFYFGWTFTNARALYFGIDPSAFGYTTQDYLLRSVDPIFIPLGTLLVVAVSLVSLHSVLVRRLGDVPQPRLRRLVIATLASVGCASFTAGLFGVVNGSLFGETFLVTPLTLAFGLGAMAYSAQLSRRLAGRWSAPGRTGAPARSAATARVILVALFIVLNVFWAVRDWANAVGRGRAQELARIIPDRPSVVVYSKSELHIDAPGVEITEVGGDESAYRFRYQGLTMLVYSNDRYFLVVTQSSPDNPRTIVLPDRDDLRLEFSSRLLD